MMTGKAPFAALYKDIALIRPTGGLPEICLPAL
jgi:hypothetical protein